MSYEHRIESTLRASAYRAPVEPVRARDEATVTGLTKSTALSNLDQARGGAGISKDRGGETGFSGNAVGTQDKIPALSFSDLIDVINPLQHIPLVSNIYRSITGDEISKPAQVAGDALFFGPIGAAVSIANLVVDEATGLNLGDQVAALLTGNPPGEETSASAEPAEVSLQAQQPGPGEPVALALDSSLAEAPVDAGAPLSPDQPFVFDTPAPSFVSDAPRAIGFAGPSEPVALESLPADILAALYSGQPLQMINQVQGTETASATPQPEATP